MLKLLRAEMKNQGVSQEAVAAELGTSQACICSYLSGAKQPGLRKLEMMFKLLGIQAVPGPGPAAPPPGETP